MSICKKRTSQMNFFSVLQSAVARVVSFEVALDKLMYTQKSPVSGGWPLFQFTSFCTKKFPLEHQM